MAQVLRQSTAIDVRLGPAMAIDGVTPVTSLTIGAADQAEVLKANGAATVAMVGTLAAVTGCDGWYDYMASTGDLDTTGTLDIVIQDASLMLPLFSRFQVIHSKAFDAIYSATPTILDASDIGMVYKDDPVTVTDQVTFVMPAASFVTANLMRYQTVDVYKKSTDEHHTTWIVSLNESTETIVTAEAPPFTLTTGATSDVTIRVSRDQHPRAAVNNAALLTSAAFTIFNTFITGAIRLFTRKDADNTTTESAALNTINNDHGGGPGLFDPARESLEALSDRLPTSLTIGGRIKAAIQVINGRLVIGTGTPTTDEWRDGGPEV